ncbi:ABC transporter ATP-binding protein [bacterium]|nr:ABC transporter ATP-binding protein [bacterium]
MSSVLLEAVDIHKSYPGVKGKVKVLAGGALHLAAGESLAVLGGSGSGKSTLLHILGTLDRPDSGSLHFEGRDLLGLKARELSEFRRNELGFVFQFHHLLPEFSAQENAAMPLRIAGVGEDEAMARAASILETLDLGHRLEHRPPELSGGEQQRVAVARALVGSPRLVLADEPTGNLDEKNGAALVELLFARRDEDGFALILVTHDEQLAQRCSRRIRLEKGILGAS